jgi:multidrug transporter EmrE-like cation transporter
LILALGVIFNAAANILMKFAANHAGASDKGLLLRLFTEPTLMAGVACFGIALAFYTVALTKFELSVAYPIMTSLGLVLVFAFSILGFKESLHLTKIAGTLLIMAGVVLVTRGSGT